jgi:hypothetical protein
MHWVAVYFTFYKLKSFKDFTDLNQKLIDKWNTRYPSMDGLYPIYWKDDHWAWNEPKIHELELYKAICHSLLHATKA